MRPCGVSSLHSSVLVAGCCHQLSRWGWEAVHVGTNQYLHAWRPRACTVFSTDNFRGLGTRNFEDCEWTLRNGSSKNRFEYVKDQFDKNQVNEVDSRMSILDGAKIDPGLQSHVQVPLGWIDHFCHVGSSPDCNSIASSGLLAGGRSAHIERQTCLFTTVSPMNEPTECPPNSVNQPRWHHTKPIGKFVKTQFVGSI